MFKNQKLNKYIIENIIAFQNRDEETMIAWIPSTSLWSKRRAVGPETYFTDWKPVRVVKFARSDEQCLNNEVCWIIFLNFSKILHRCLSPYFESTLIHQSLSRKNIPFSGEFVAVSFTGLTVQRFLIKTRKFG